MHFISPVVDILLIAAAAALLLPIAVFAAECLIAALPARSLPATMPRGGSRTRQSLAKVWRLRLPGRMLRSIRDASAAVLIPAHNEEAVLQRTLCSLRAELGSHDRVLVVADNCTDRTAQIARDCAVEVVERYDPGRRGKSYALEFGRRLLAENPPEVVVVLDADCDVAPGSIAVLSERAVETGRPVQALNLCLRDEGQDGRVGIAHRHHDQCPLTNVQFPISSGARIGGIGHWSLDIGHWSFPPPVGGVHPTLSCVSELGFRFKNLVRPLGLARLGLPCQLTGTGMAFPWRLWRDIDLGGDELAEDMQLGVELALQGAPPVFCPEARVASCFPDQRAALVTQRTRWEQGHLRTLIRHVPRLICAAVTRRRPYLAALALDLLVPPLALLVLAWMIAACTTAIAALLGASPLPLAMLAGGGAVLVVAVAAGWAVHCRKRVPPAAVLSIPRYVLLKLPIYVSFFLRRGERRWIRTARGGTGIRGQGSVGWNQ